MFHEDGGKGEEVLQGRKVPLPPMDGTAQNKCNRICAWCSETKVLYKLILRYLGENITF